MYLQKKLYIKVFQFVNVYGDMSLKCIQNDG